jgi:hypothetical protein
MLFSLVMSYEKKGNGKTMHLYAQFASEGRWPRICNQ